MTRSALSPPLGATTVASIEVVLLTRNSLRPLDGWLQAMRHAVLDAGGELMFVDLGSTDGTREYVVEEAPGARGIWLEADDGLTEALEAAAMASSAERLIFVDPSAKPAPESLLEFLEDLPELPPGVAASGPGLAAIYRPALLEALQQGDEAQIASQLLAKLRRPVVLHVVECFADGTERHVLDLVRHTPEIDHVLAVPSSHGGRTTAQSIARAQSLGARIEVVEMRRSRSLKRQARTLATLRRLIDRLAPDVVHGHSSIGGAMARIATLGMRVPVVYTPHGVSRSRWALAVERMLALRADRLIAVSNSERAFMLHHQLADQRKMVVIPNGIELEPPPPLSQSLRARLDIADDVPLIGCIGRLAWDKAPELFVSACSLLADRLPEARFVLIGSGPYQGIVEKAVALTGIQDRFHLLPALPGAAAIMHELDVFVLPSRFEGLPYTAMEAMRAGTPVVVTDVAGNNDVVEHWVSGLLVPLDEPYALAAAISTLLKDRALSERLVRGARERLTQFGVDSMAEATSALYRELGEPDSAGPLRDVAEQLGVRRGALVP